MRARSEGDTELITAHTHPQRRGEIRLGPGRSGGKTGARFRMSWAGSALPSRCHAARCRFGCSTRLDFSSTAARCERERVVSAPASNSQWQRAHCKLPHHGPHARTLAFWLLLSIHRLGRLLRMLLHSLCTLLHILPPASRPLSSRPSLRQRIAPARTVRNPGDTRPVAITSNPIKLTLSSFRWGINSRRDTPQTAALPREPPPLQRCSRINGGRLPHCAIHLPTVQASRSSLHANTEDSM